MSLYRRQDSRYWWASITKPGGGTVCRSTGTEDRKQAQEWYDKTRAELWRIHRLGEKPAYCWEDAVVRWCSEKQDKKTVDEDIAKFRWLDQYLRGRALSSISQSEIAAIGEVKKSEATAATANRYLALIRSVLRRAAGAWEWIDRAPNVTLFKEPKRRIKWLTPEQREALINALPEHQRPYVEFALETGLRQANVIRLEWAQVDLARRVCWIFADQAKAGQPIGVPLSVRAAEILAAQQGKHGINVFTYRGHPVAWANTRAWRRALKTVGLEGLRWHDLRHAWASAHIMSGTTLAELQELGGWKTEAMVRRYAHLAPDHLRLAAEKSATFWLRSGKSKDQKAVQVIDLMVPTERFELPTNGLQNRCSTS